MTVYFVKRDDKIYRFGGWSDMENLTGRLRDKSKKSLARAVREVFPRDEIADRSGAKIRGWIDEDGKPTKNFNKGNTWTERGARPLESLGGGSVGREGASKKYPRLENGVPAPRRAEVTRD